MKIKKEETEFQTIQLYNENAYQVEFQATVLDCIEQKEEYHIILDRTAFFPEGGGQYGDRGQLNEVEVFDTQIKDGIILHYTKHPIEVGTTVQGVIDWKRRYSMMQNHSSEHMVSGLIHKKYGYDNVGFHLGEEEMTLDFNGMLTMEQLLLLEREVNEVIWRNMPVEITFPTKEELETMSYRSKKEIEGSIRIVTIEGIDVCACCAPHVRRTGEIGCVKIISVQKNKSGVRVTVLAGDRALSDYEKKHEGMMQICKLLSIKPEQAFSVIKHLQEEKQRVEYELLEYKLSTLKQQAEQVIPHDGILCMETKALSGKEIREVCNCLMERGTLGIVLNRQEEEQMEFQYIIGSKQRDVREIASLLKEKLNGRGGGKPQMIQGTAVGTKEEVLALISRIKECWNE